MRSALSRVIHPAQRNSTHRRARVVVPLLGGFLLLTLFATLAQPVAAFPAAQQTDLSPGSVVAGGSVVTGGFVAVGGSVRLPGTDASAPSLAIQPQSVEPWVALVQNNGIFVSKYITTTATWTELAGILNRGSANVARDPSLTFAGDNLADPWAAWSEDVGGVIVINASSFNGTTWNLTPVVNHAPTHSATNPTIAAGALVTGSTPLPWLVWEERAASSVPQVVVSRAQADTRAQGGFSWQAVGGSLNFDPARSALNPDLAFAGAAKTVPWVVWTESGGTRAERLFAKRWNGTSWESVGRQAACADEVACALNINAISPATNVRIAAGALPNEAIASPWLVFSEEGANGRQEIHVMRLDVGVVGDSTDDRFVAVGGAVNAECLGNAGVSSARANNIDLRAAGQLDAAAQQMAEARTSGGIATAPEIVFVGNVPHIAWVEAASGREVLYVCHLADGRSGLERWDLDTIDGVNRRGAVASQPSLAANATTPYVAWQEPLTNTVVYVAHRAPTGPAWGANFPARLTDIAGAPALNMMTSSATDVDAAAVAQPMVRSAAVPLVTAAYHVNGVEQLEEVQLQLLARNATTETTPIFYGRYVISDNLVYVQDPERPGNFFAPVAPGSASSNINTPFITLEPSTMSVTNHGAPSAALDVNWSLIFEDATFFHHYVQAINIVHDGGQETGFFQVGTVYVGSQIYLPIVAGE